MSDEPQVLSYSEAADLLSVSERTLERWVHERRIPFVQFPKRGTRSGVRFVRAQVLKMARAANGAANTAENRRDRRCELKKTRGVFFRNGVAHIRFQDEQGHIVRESTGQRSLKVAQQILDKRRSEVAMGKHFRTRQFDQVTFGELLDTWWERHGKNTRSRFSYHLPLIKARFANLKARAIRPEDIEGFLSELDGRDWRLQP